MHELQKHYAKRKKPVTKDHILYESVYQKCSVLINLETVNRSEAA